MIMRATQKKIMSKPVTSTSVGWKAFQAFGLLGPALSAEGPECRAKPGVEYIFVLAEGYVAQVVFFTDVFFAVANIGFTGFVVPGGNAVAPPELA